MDVGLRMPKQVFWQIVIIGLLAAGAARAQTPPVPTGDPAADPMPRRETITESDLETFWLRTDKGKLVLVPEMTLELYQELSLLKDQVIHRDSAPDFYAFQGDVGFTGTASEHEAQFTVQLNIRLRENEDADSLTWIRVPLRLNQSILMPGVKHVGPGDFFVSYEKQGDGYVAWLRAAANSDHAITLRIKLPVVRVAGRMRVSLLTPQRPTQLQLEVPGTDLDVATNNLVENILTTKKVANTKTRISVENVGGPLEITWREKNLSAAVLESAGTTRATINGQQIDYETELRVRSYGAPIQTFDVRLPADAILIPEPTPGVRVDVLAESSRNARLVRVTREDGKEDPALEVRLKAFSISPDKVLSGQTEVSGFEVVDAVRQTGSLDLAVVGDWTVDWFPGSYVRQVPVSDSQRQGGAVARFEYDRQPYSLKVEVRALEPRIRVAPTYSLFVEATQLRLVGNLKYSASGARIRELLIQAEGWQIDRVLPAELVAQKILLNQTAPLSIPLAPNGKPLAEDFEIRIEAHQPITTDDNSFSVVLPRTVNVVASPATVAVYPADNVDLTLRGEEIRGLIAESAPPGLAAPKTQQPAMFYVEELSEAAAVFAGDFNVRSRVVAVNVENTLKFTTTALAIEQRFDLEISYEPLRQIKFNMPETMTPNDGVQFFELIPEAATAANGGFRERPLPVMGMVPAEEPGSAELTVDLLEDRITSCSIVARYGLPITPQAATDPLALKLIRVAADPSITVGTSKLRLVAAEEVDVELVSEGWATLIDDLVDPSSREQLFQTSGGVAGVDVLVRLVQTPQLRAMVLEKFWLQTYWSPSLRQDRACFQLRTSSERIQVQLPAGATLLDVAVQGLQQQNAKASDTGIVAIELDPQATANTYTVEVWYWFLAKDVPVARLTVEPPTLVGVQQARRNYWQLILPRVEHLLIPPPSLTPEYVWRWNSNHWGRYSNRGQADLEAAMNASRQEGPPEQVNQYLFTSVGPILPVEFITASRGSLTLVLSLTVLVTGLCMIYFAWARHPASLLILGVLVVSLGFAFPEPTILGAQAAGLGIAFVLFARLLHRKASRRQGAAIPSTGSSISQVDSKEGFVVQVVPEGNSHTTTTLAPTTYQVPIAESKS